MNTTSTIKHLALCSVAALLLTGCATEPQTGSEPENIEYTPDKETRTRNLNPLIEAPDRMQAACSSIKSFSAEAKFNQLLFWCPSLDVTATIEEIRDAGWEPESIDIGEITKSPEGKHSMPVKITIRKLQ